MWETLVLACIISIGCLQAARDHPPVSTFSVVATSPWSVLLSWDQPIVQTPPAPKEYFLIGNVTETVFSSEKYVFLFKDTGIQPGKKFHVKIGAKYDDGTFSSPMEAEAEMPIASKLAIGHLCRYGYVKAPEKKRVFIGCLGACKA